VGAGLFCLIQEVNMTFIEEVKQDWKVNRASRIRKMLFWGAMGFLIGKFIF